MKVKVEVTQVQILVFHANIFFLYRLTLKLQCKNNLNNANKKEKDYYLGTVL